MTQNLPSYIRPAAFLGAIIGLVLGVLMILPIIQLFAVFIFFGVGSIVMIMLKQNHFRDSFQTKDGMIIGGISGFVSVLSASLIFLILALLFGNIFSGTYDLIRAFFMSFSSFVVLLILIFCIAFMNMMFNMGSAVLVLSLYENVKNEENKTEFKVEKE